MQRAEAWLGLSAGLGLAVPKPCDHRGRSVKGSSRRCRVRRLTRAQRTGSEAAQPTKWEENSNVEEGGQRPLVKITPQSLTGMQVKKGQHTEDTRILEETDGEGPLETQ